jgi:hypothetical protein
MRYSKLSIQWSIRGSPLMTFTGTCLEKVARDIHNFCNVTDSQNDEYNLAAQIAPFFEILHWKDRICPTEDDVDWMFARYSHLCDYFTSIAFALMRWSVSLKDRLVILLDRDFRNVTKLKMNYGNLIRQE